MNITRHTLVPSHFILPPEEKKNLLHRYKVATPTTHVSWAVIKHSPVLHCIAASHHAASPIRA